MHTRVHVLKWHADMHTASTVWPQGSADSKLLLLLLSGQVGLADEDGVEAERNPSREFHGGHRMRTHCLGVPHAEL